MSIRSRDRKEDSDVIERKMKKNLRELKSLRHRANPHVYDKKIVERKRRLRARIQHLKAPESENKA